VGRVREKLKKKLGRRVGCRHVLVYLAVEEGLSTPEEISAALDITPASVREVLHILTLHGLLKTDSSVRSFTIAKEELHAPQIAEGKRKDEELGGMEL